MRPAITDTPPMSHVMSKILQPMPVLMCGGLDWKNLTSDNSIQILDSSEYLLDESICQQSFISNHIKIIDRITNFQSDDERSVFGVSESIPKHYIESVSDTIISVESMILPRGEILESRVIFTPTGSKSKAPSSETIDDRTGSKSDRSLKRTRYSDTDILRATPKRQVSVTRTRSVGWAESDKRGGDLILLQPLKPSAYETKISDVKKIPSSRPVSGNKDKGSCSESMMPVEQCYMKDDNTHCREKGNNPLLHLPKLNIAKLVKIGLKSVKYSKNTQQKVGQTEHYYNQQLKKHRRGMRYSSAIGGLSEFLRKTERRRKTLYDIPEVVDNDIIPIKIVVTKPETSSDQPGSKTSDKQCFTPQPLDVVNEKCSSSTGSSKLTVTQCQRKLCFDEHDKSNQNIESANKNVTMLKETTFGSSSIDRCRRPRLGIVSSKKNAKFVPLEGLEMEMVTHLKRKVDCKIRSTCIKTNGSLNRTRKLSNQKSVSCLSPIWRKSFRLNRVSKTKPLKMSRESVV